VAVRYITVTPVTKLFKPATRAFGDVAIVGAAQNDDLKLTQTEVDNLVTADPEPTLDQVKEKLRKTFPASEDVDKFFKDNEIADVAGFKSKGTNFVTILKATGPSKRPIPITNPNSVSDKSNPEGKDKPVDDVTWFNGDLGKSVRKTFDQTPGPTTVWAVRTDPGDGDNSIAKALDEVAKLDVQIVTLANTPLLSAEEGRTEIELLSSHVNTVSKTGGDGKERIGVAMLGKDVRAPAIITGNMSNERMVVIAHTSTEDAAAAVAGTIAGYEPHISLLLKPVSLSMDTLFSDSDIDAFNTARVNWLTDPTLIPGKGLFMGEGYTLGADIPYIDIIRTIDDVSFRLKAQLIRSIGDLRVSRSGLRTLVSQMTAVLEPLKQREVIEEYDIFLPLLVLLDKDPGSLTDAELEQINNAQNARTVDAIVSVDYAGAIHRLNITLKFE
jgi:hypothetical protein